MQCGLVDLVQVRPLLAVNLDVDEVVVHHAGGGLVLEGFVRHHVTPVASGVADRQEDRLVLVLRLLQSGVVPGLPMHGIVGVLAQVRAGLPVEPVGHVREFPRIEWVAIYLINGFVLTAELG